VLLLDALHVTTKKLVRIHALLVVMVGYLLLKVVLSAHSTARLVLVPQNAQQPTMVSY